ncbi:MAG: type II toxin-antitoxin system Phd/YefM family antitoxin [Waddliaceae bacterium]
MPAAEAKTNFGALLDSAQREPVTISKKGRPVAVLMSMEEFKEHEGMKLERLKQEIKIGLDQIERNEVSDGKEVFAQLEEELDR